MDMKLNMLEVLNKEHGYVEGFLNKGHGHKYVHDNLNRGHEYFKGVKMFRHVLQVWRCWKRINRVILGLEFSQPSYFLSSLLWRTPKR